MPTIITHALVPAALALAAGPQRISPKLAVMGVALAILPDADVLGFGFGIQYGDEWGHRGASHSILFALIVAAGISLIWREARGGLAFVFLAVAAASHGLLDSLTNGGFGIALLWPMDQTRYFAPHTPVLVSPIGAHFFSLRGLQTLWSEMLWIWLPLLALAIGGWKLRLSGKG